MTWIIETFRLNWDVSLNNDKLFTDKTFLVALFSSNTNEGIRAVLFLLRKDFTSTKKCKNAHKRTKTKRAVLNVLKKHLRGTETKRAVLNVLKKHLRGTKTKRAVLNVLKKHLRGRKLPIHLFTFLCFSCAFCAFCAF